MNEPHQHRQVAESFGSDAERYDRARPSYPGALVERIVAASPGPDVLDVGCGTGIAARQFQAAGCRVLGVDPDARMADLTRQSGITRDQWLEQVPTFGGHSQIPPARQQEILAGIGTAIDALGGSFTMHYTTVAVTAARTSAPHPAG